MREGTREYSNGNIQLTNCIISGFCHLILNMPFYLTVGEFLAVMTVTD